VPAIARLDDADLARMAAAGLPQPERLAEAAAIHDRALELVRSALHAHGCDEIRERRIDALRAEDATAVDLAVAVGGDGTVFAVHGLLDRTPCWRSTATRDAASASSPAARRQAPPSSWPRGGAGGQPWTACPACGRRSTAAASGACSMTVC
jgi:hypothetical protein